MFGLAKEITLDFLVGAELLQICVGQYQVILRFEDDLEISLECDCRVFPQQAHWSRAYDLSAAINLLALLGQTIVAVDNSGNGEVSLKFSGGNTLVINDSNEGGESFQISGHGHEIIV